MKSIFLISLILLLSSKTNSQCGPASCYSGCTDSRVPLDLIFILDVSGSMQSSINGVVSGLTQFADDLKAKSVVPWYTLIVYGNTASEAVVLLNAEADGNVFKNKVAKINVDGWWEPALETIRRGLGTASVSNFNINLRSGSKRALILLTDEDSDPAYFSGNRFQSHTGNSGCSWNFNEYQSEVDATVQAILDKKFTSYSLIKKGTGESVCYATRQFGDFSLQEQSSDFKTFDMAKTLAKLTNAGLQNSLQGKLLAAGRLARVFDVSKCSDSTFIKNFFESITSDVSACDPCTDYMCSASNTCLAPVYVCGCDGVRNSGKVEDGFGGCCLPSERDCNGRCAQTSSYDVCGVCMPNGQISSLCKLDCENRRYLESKPSGVYTSVNFQPNPAGYLLSNPDLYTQFASPTGSLRSINALRNHFHEFGRFENRYTCQFDASKYAAQYSVTVANAESDWIANLLANTNLSTKKQAFCVVNSRKKIAPSLKDACGQCIVNPDTPPYCVTDCLNQLRTSIQTAYFIDNCGKCVAPGTNRDANKDDCGICFGNNADKNQCGVCFGTTAKDQCNQPVCQGSPCLQNCAKVYEPVLTKDFDDCRYCVDIGTRSPDCLQDCAGQYYRRNSTPQNKYDDCGICVSSSVTRSPQCVADCRPVYLSNLALAYVNDNCGKCVAPGTNLNANKDDCDVCFGNNTAKNNCSVCFGTTAIDSCGNYVCRNISCAKNCKGISETLPFTWNLDECSYCQPVVNGVVQRNTSCIQDCAGKYYVSGTTPLNKYDDCNLCIPSTKIRNESCINDCRQNVWFTDVAKKYFVDECQQCVPPGSNPNANKDDCGVCFGGNAAKNQCGKCFETKDLDNCNNPICQKRNCSRNCDDEFEEIFSKEFDICGYCVLLGTTSNLCLTDCNGKRYRTGSNPNFKLDDCGYCVPFTDVRSPLCKQDCAGKWNGSAYYDQCNQCVDAGKAPFQCAQDCSGLNYRIGKDSPIHTIDDCQQCSTQANFNNLKDKCGICQNKPDYDSAKQCTPDCKGIFSLITDPRSFVDICGDCWFANQTAFNNYRMDKCGVCLPTRDDINWNSGEVFDPITKASCGCYVVLKECIDLKGKSYLTCFDCPPTNPCSTGLPDSCGLCPGKSMYGKRDKCGMCCSPEDGVACDVDVDDCGECFGGNLKKEKNPCKICDGTKCVIDCFGKANGTAVFGCDGICGSTAKCIVCGNGVVDEGETCDLGNGKNTKGSGCFNCVQESDQSTAGRQTAIIIGSIAGALGVGVAAILAYVYAKKNGLIGKSGKNVDFSGSNSNPLYKSEVQVNSNPLYIN